MKRNIFLGTLLGLAVLGLSVAACARKKPVVAPTLPPTATAAAVSAPTQQAQAAAPAPKPTTYKRVDYIKK